MADGARKLKRIASSATAIEGVLSELEDEKRTLEEDIITLRSKKTHIARELEKREKALSQFNDNWKARKHDLLAKIEDYRAKEYTAREKLKKLLLAIKKARRDFDEAKREQESELAAVDGKITDARFTLDVVNTQLEAVKSNIEAAEKDKARINDHIELKRAELKEVQNNIDEARKLAESDRAAEKERRKEMSNDITAAEVQLAKLREESQKIEARAVEVEKKETDFAEYEKRAKKALKSKESSLAETEKKLREDMRQFKRRNSVLENIT